jgi:hypothetical protein
MYRNEPKDVQEWNERCTSFIKLIGMLLKTATEETKKSSLRNYFYSHCPYFWHCDRQSNEKGVVLYLIETVCLSLI